jgi:hypothetical protein
MHLWCLDRAEPSISQILVTQRHILRMVALQWEISGVALCLLLFVESAQSMQHSRRIHDLWLRDKIIWFSN